MEKETKEYKREKDILTFILVIWAIILILMLGYLVGVQVEKYLSM